MRSSSANRSRAIRSRSSCLRLSSWRAAASRIAFEAAAPGDTNVICALESGRGARKNRAQDGGFSLRIYHGATPETETSCHYYFAINNGCMARSEADNDKLFQEIWDTFLEDIDFVERQQARLEADPERPLVDIKHDSARIQARRKIERMVAAESAVAVAAE